MRMLTSVRAAVDRVPSHGPGTQPMLGQDSFIENTNSPEHSSRFGCRGWWGGGRGYPAKMETQ